MKKVTTILAAILLMAVGATAQKLSYQAVVRNSSNELVPNTALTVEVSVLDAVGTVQYAETHSATTNQNGLLVLTIGDGTVTTGTTVADVDWNGAAIQSVVKNGSAVVATITSPVNAVPYALQAGNSAGSLSQVNADWEATSGVAEILHKPTIPTVNDGTLTITLPDGTSETFTANQGGNTNVSIPAMSVADLIALVGGMTDAEKEQLRDALGVTGDGGSGGSGGGGSDPTTFVCGTSTVTDHEGNVYNTVKIGNQCWTKENLRTTTSPSTGTYLIPVAGTGSTYTGKQARWYNDDSATYAQMNYGLLYNWNAAVDTFNTAYGETSVNTSSGNVVSVNFNGHRRGICPIGWHLPREAEWKTLTDYVGSVPEYQCGGSSTKIAKALASETGWSNYYSGECYPSDQSVTANNASGFSAVAAGNWYGSSYMYSRSQACFWSATQSSSITNAHHLRMNSNYAVVISYENPIKYDGNSVRCLRDAEPGGEEPTSFNCGTSKMVDADGNEYETVQIGTQCWTKTNLRVAPAGATDATSSGASSNTVPYYYVNSAVNPAVCGYYYNWEAAKLACPAGWHLPSDAEWITMEQTQTSMDVTGLYWRGDHAGKLAGEGWNSSTTAGAPGNASDPDHNASGFSAVPAGSCNGSLFNYAGDGAYFWSATQDASNPNYAYRRYLGYSNASVGRDNGNKDGGRSVRCVRD